MNPKAEAYLQQHGRWLTINGEAVFMLPLDAIQGFLDLLQPGDVPPDTLQKLYRYQDKLVAELKRQLDADGVRDGPKDESTT